MKASARRRTSGHRARRRGAADLVYQPSFCRNFAHLGARAARLVPRNYVVSIDRGRLQGCYPRLIRGSRLGAVSPA